MVVGAMVSVIATLLQQTVEAEDTQAKEKKNKPKKRNGTKKAGGTSSSAPYLSAHRGQNSMFGGGGLEL